MGNEKTRSLLQAMGKLGYDAANVGERELSAGYDDFLAKTKGIGFPFVSANIVRSDTRAPVFQPYTVLSVKGAGGKPVRVGVLGVVRFNPVFQKAGPAGANLVIAPPAEMLKKYVPELRTKADVVIVLAAVHKDDMRTIAREVPGIDLVLGAYSGMLSAQDELEGTTHLRYTGNQGRYVGESRVSLSKEGRTASVANYVHQLTARYPSDEAMAQWVTREMGRINGQAQQASTPAAAAGHPGH